MTVKEIYGTDFPVILAPMAGITDLPFRILCKEQGADVMVTEMISAKALFYGNKNTLPAYADRRRRETDRSADFWPRAGTYGCNGS